MYTFAIGEPYDLTIHGLTISLDKSLFVLSYKSRPF